MSDRYDFDDYDDEELVIRTEEAWYLENYLRMELKKAKEGGNEEEISDLEKRHAKAYDVASEMDKEIEERGIDVDDYK